MKKLILSATLLCFFSCNEDDNCNIGAIDQNAVCIEVYDPVCGCNNITYSNDCQATANGTVSYTHLRAHETN